MINPCRFSEVAAGEFLYEYKAVDTGVCLLLKVTTIKSGEQELVDAYDIKLHEQNQQFNRWTWSKMGKSVATRVPLVGAPLVKETVNGSDQTPLI